MSGCSKYWKASGNTCYFVPYRYTQNWMIAHRICKRLHGNLASVKSIVSLLEMGVLLDNVLQHQPPLDNPSFYIGRKSVGDWKWLDGEAVNVSSSIWHEFNGDDFDCLECAMIAYISNTYKLKKSPCNSTSFYIFDSPECKFILIIDKINT